MKLARARAYCCGHSPLIGCTLCTRNSCIGAPVVPVVPTAVAAPGDVCGTITPTTWTRCPENGLMLTPDRRNPPVFAAACPAVLIPAVGGAVLIPVAAGGAAVTPLVAGFGGGGGVVAGGIGGTALGGVAGVVTGGIAGTFTGGVAGVTAGGVAAG